MQTGSLISILGCGWLGLPLAERLLQAGYQVKGSTTTPSKLPLLAEKGIKPSLIYLHDSAAGALADFVQADVLVISFPPGLRAGKGEAYLEQIGKLAGVLRQVSTPRILFLSSTAVYPDLNRVVTEADACPPNHALIQAESLLAALPDKAVTIVRLAGLAGGSRQPGRFLAGKTQVANPLAPVNLIHLDDCVEILFQIIKQEKWPALYNACADEHPTREAFYTAAALAAGLTPPQFAAPSPADGYKIISNAKIKQDLHYVFRHPDPRSFF